MIKDETRKLLQNIIQGISDSQPADRCSEIRDKLIRSFGSSRTSKKGFEDKRLIKEKQALFLRELAGDDEDLIDRIPEDCSYLTAGGESQVFLSSNGLYVIKVNNAPYYSTWTEYFTSLVLHNLLFPSTAYSLIGFYEDPNSISPEDSFFAIVQQPFIVGGQASLAHIKEFLDFNEFRHISRQDYFNTEFHIRLEDMHDENVINSNGLLFFIDTVFYLMDD